MGACKWTYGKNGRKPRGGSAGSTPEEWYLSLNDREQMLITKMQVNTTNINKFNYDQEYAESLSKKQQDEFREETQVISNALSKYELRDPITTYRGVSEDEFINTLYGDAGNTSFKSSSYDSKRAEAFARNQGGYIIEYHISPGHYGADVGGAPGANESEFLINIGVPQNIISAKGNRLIIQVG